MKKYKVIALNVTGLNRVHYAGEILSENVFPSNKAAELVEKGFLEEMKKEEIKEIEKEEAKEVKKVKVTKKK